MSVPGIRFCSLHLLAVLFWCTVSCADREHSFSEEDISAAGDLSSAADYIVVTGAQVLLSSHIEELRNKRIGVVANHTARVGEAHLLDLLLDEDLNVTALFAPEHGFRGDVPAGEEIRDGTDLATGLPVHSLYGQTRKPSTEMLQDIDLLLFDMQDVGARFYTYISTLGLVMEAASEAAIPVWVLDRPNPLGGEYVSGWILEEKHRSFVGMYPMPVVHGLTVGEFALMAAGERWLEFDRQPDIRVIQMENWSRGMNWTDTELDWRPPSPNLPHFTNALMYPGTCFFEGSNMSEGRGTSDPFMITGSPTISPDITALSYITGRYPVSLEVISFVPQSIPGVAVNPKHKGVENKGVRISPLTLDPSVLRPLEAGLELFREMLRLDPEAETNRFLYNLAGTRRIDDFLSGDEAAGADWQEEVNAFRELREPYLLY
jgi:uncharacterized protein YbbC (DUF1343 family)